MTDFEELIAAAQAVVGGFPIGRDFSAGGVGAAIRSLSGRIYTGICLDLACGIGFCAEYAAVANMLKERETIILAVVAVDGKSILPPCGRCRELMLQIDERNAQTQVILSISRVVPLKELLPDYWLDSLNGLNK